MAKSALRFFVTLLDRIINRIEGGTYSTTDFEVLISKFEEKLFPLVQFLYYMELNTANKCFDKGEDIETIEEYLMVFLSLLLVKGFFQLTSNISAFEKYNFDLEVNNENSENLETIMEMYQFNLMDCLEEYVKIKPSTKSNDKELSNRGNSEIKENKENKEDDFPDYDDHKSEEGDLDSDRPNFNNLYYNQQTKDYVTKDTYGRTESGISTNFVSKDTFKNTQSGINNSESAMRFNNQNINSKNNNEVLTKVENILKTKMTLDEKGILYYLVNRIKRL